jgi:Na+-translocating ferredoxin:NAD+ oxidoreductase subunit G
MAVRADAGLPRAARAALVLAAAALAAFGLVALVQQVTRDRIAEAARQQALARFDAVLAGMTYDNDLLADPVTLRDPDHTGEAATVVAYRARRAGGIVAVVMEIVAPDGYSGAIRLLVAIAPDGKVLATRVVQHKETPGLGDFIDARKSDWIERFSGRSLQSPPAAGWRVRKDGGEFDQYTGATVTSRATVAAVARSLALFELHRDAVLAAPARISP